MRKTLKKIESPKKNKLGDLVISLIDVKSGLAPFDKLKIHEYLAMLINRSHYELFYEYFKSRYR